MRVGLKLRLLAALHGANGAINFHPGSVSDMNFTIPRSDWVEKYLPALGYGGLEILEIRYGSGVAGDGLRKSVAEIKEAKKNLSEGQWDKAVLHCRIAVEEILASKTASVPSPHFEQKVNTFITDNLPGIDDTEARMLADQMKLIWKVASTAVHGDCGVFQSLAQIKRGGTDRRRTVNPLPLSFRAWYTLAPWLHH